MDNVVIIPVHNQLPYLVKCVESVIEKTKNLKLIIVDDGSTDKLTIDWIRKNEKKLGYYRIRHDSAMGFSKACNDGMKYAVENYDFTCLCLLNSDTIVQTDDWFGKVEYFYTNGENIGCASVMSDNALAQSIKNERSYLARIDSKPTVQSYLVHGFCYFISREAILKLGYLDDKEFPHYGSEDDFSLRCVTTGFTNLLVGSVFVRHNNATSYTDKQRQSIVIHSFPALNKRWGAGFVNRCGIMSAKAGKYINDK